MKMKRETIRKAKTILIVTAALFAVAGCGKGEETSDVAQPQATQAPVKTPQPLPTYEPLKTLKTERFNFKAPKNWKDDSVIEVKKEGGVTYTAFYAKKCHEETGEGLLFSIGEFGDESYRKQVSYSVVGKNKKMTYVAVYPEKIQTTGASEEAKEQYENLSGMSEQVAASLAEKKEEKKGKKGKK